MGQIYVPWINGVLMVAVLTLVLAFRSSAALAYAFGMAVTGTITITTLLFLYQARPLAYAAVDCGGRWGGALLVVDLMFFAANLTKLVHGAWLPLLIAIAAFTVMVTWQRGRDVVTKAREEAEGPLQDFVDKLVADPAATVRIPGTAVFLNRGGETAPLSMRANVEHNHVLHEHAVIMSLDVQPVPPRVPDDQRITLDNLGYTDDGISFVSAKFGYMERPDVPAALRLVEEHPSMEAPLSVDDATYFLSKLELTPGDAPTMAPWRKRLFIATSYITADAAGHFGLPLDRTVIIGSRIEV